MEKKGLNIEFDLFAMNDNYCSIAMGSSNSGYIRILSSVDFLGNDPVKETEIHLEGQIIKNIFLPITTDITKQNMYYTTQNGVYYIDYLENNKKGSLIYSQSPQFCGINIKGEFICADNQFIRKINPKNNDLNTQTYAEGSKKAISIYK